ncbi:MAG TPA: polysaccharide deacetylase family protein [Planctomycetota bacterium]
MIEPRPVLAPTTRRGMDPPRGFDGRACLQTALEMTGLASLYVRLRGVRGATILAYHSVTEARDQPWVDPRYQIRAPNFERQMRFLARRRRVVSMTRLAEAVENGDDLPAGTVALTFDDGYLSHLTVAAPILEKYGLPATFLLPTGYVRRGQVQWADRLYGLFQRRTAHRLGWNGEEVDLRDPLRASDAYRRASLALLEAGYEERQRLLDDLEARLRPDGHPPRMTMTWSDVRALTGRSPAFEIGGHTRDHLDLRAHASLATAEITACAEEIEAEVGAPPRHFSFPYGRWTPDAQKTLRSLGFRSSVGAGLDFLIRKTSDRFALPPLDPLVSRARFAYLTSGAHPGLTRALVGRA